MIAHNADFPDDHHPHVDVVIGPNNVADVPKWLAENTTGAYQMVFLAASASTKDIGLAYRFHFVEERDAVLFKTFFG